MPVKHRCYRFGLTHPDVPGLGHSPPSVPPKGKTGQARATDWIRGASVRAQGDALGW